MVAPMTLLYVGGEKHIQLAELTLRGEESRLEVRSEIEIGEMPSFLAFSRRRKLVVAIAEGSSELVSLSIDEGGALKELSRLPCPGGPAYVAFDRDEKFVLTGSYGSGETAIYSIDEAGRLGQEVARLATGKYTHCVVASPENDCLFAPSKGSDTVACLRFRGSETIVLPAAVCPKGSGPRHLVFSTDGEYAYVSGENDCSVSVLRHIGERLELVERYPSLSEAQGEGDTGSDIHLSRDGKTVYVSNRGVDNIAVFRANGATLELLETHSTRGEVPRNFGLFDGELLIAANQESRSLSVFRRDSSGLLKYEALVETTERPFFVGNPTSH